MTCCFLSAVIGENVLFFGNVGFNLLNFADIGRLVSVKGMIIRCSSIIPEIKDAVFRCLICGHFTDPVPVDKGDLVYCFFPLVNMKKSDV